jgi:hypothetical protein
VNHTRLFSTFNPILPRKELTGRGGGGRKSIESTLFGKLKKKGLLW